MVSFFCYIYIIFTFVYYANYLFIMSDFIFAILFLEIMYFLEWCYFPPERVYIYFHQKTINPEHQPHLRIWHDLNLNYSHWVAYSFLIVLWS